MCESEVLALGELLIDFTPAGSDAQGRPLLAQNPGGAPANTLAQMRQLGWPAAFIGMVGSDPFGRFLRHTLRQLSIDDTHLLQTKESLTTLVFVHLDHSGDRSFTFLRDPGADSLLRPTDLPEDLIARARLLHVCSVVQSREPARSAMDRAIAVAREAGTLVSYDVNLRTMLWDDLDEARRLIMTTARLADVLKVSDEELLFLTGESDPAAGSLILQTQTDAPLVLVTSGSAGASARNAQGFVASPAYDVAVVDTTGAGDAFCGAFNDCLLQAGCAPGELTLDQLADALRFANAAGSLLTARMGAIAVMPTRADIEACRRNTPLLPSRHIA